MKKMPHPPPSITIAVVAAATTLLLSSVVAVVDAAASTLDDGPPPPQLNGRHFRITALHENGFLDIHHNNNDDDDDNMHATFSGYLIDMLEAIARPNRANFTYTLLPPSGHGSLCVPRLLNSTSTTTTASDDNNKPYDSSYWTQYNCGATDVNDGPNTTYATDMYLGMYYVTPSRQLLNHFTIPFLPPYSGTLRMFGTATRIPTFDVLVQQQAAGLQPPACAPGGAALLDFVAASFPGLQVQGLFGDEDDIYQAFSDGTCTVYITDGPIAAQFVKRRFQRGECLAGRHGPIGTIGEPMAFGLSHYAVGIRRDIELDVVNTLSYWMNVLMSCNPHDPDGACPDGNLATFYQGSAGDGTECGYVLYPTSTDTLSVGAMVGIVIGSVMVVVMLATTLHVLKSKRQERRFAKRQRAALQTAERERELNEFLAHEIRNPLSSAIAALNFVHLKACDATYVPVQEHRTALLSDIGVMESSLQFVNELLRNMLDLNRCLEEPNANGTGKAKIQLHMQPTDLLRDVLEPVVSILFMRGAVVEVSASCDPPNLLVLADRMRLKQICLNLATNSAKFVSTGFIRVRAVAVPIPKEQLKDELGESSGDENDDSSLSSASSPSALANNKNNVHIYVEDSGPGIPVEKRKQLFAKFQESLDVLNQGTGVGLAVCKKLSQLMQADLFLDDTYDSGVPNCPGTRFVLRLNQPEMQFLHHQTSNNSMTAVDQMETGGGGGTDALLDGNNAKKKRRSSSRKSKELMSPPPSPPQEALPPKLTVLYVDDDTILRRMFTRTLHTVAPDWIVHQAADGETALRMVTDRTTMTTTTNGGGVTAVAVGDDGETTTQSSSSTQSSSGTTITMPNNSTTTTNTTTTSTATTTTTTHDYDIIFMDQYMASHTKQLLGTETVQAMRTTKGIQRSIICGLSANDKEYEFRQAGADAFLLKPFPCQKDALTQAMLDVLHSGRHRRPSMSLKMSSSSSSQQQQQQQPPQQQQAEDAS